MSSSKARVERGLGLVVVNAVAGKDPHIFGDDAETFNPRRNLATGVAERVVERGAVTYSPVRNGRS